MLRPLSKIYQLRRYILLEAINGMEVFNSKTKILNFAASEDTKNQLKIMADVSKNCLVGKRHFKTNQAQLSLLSFVQHFVTDLRQRKFFAKVNYEKRQLSQQKKYQQNFSVNA